ncbi:MAG TPA: hypothetical protein VGX69_01925 [Solirubrobacteraceae bacterium]|jgi:hypothetical protein|nr:hypothetical protein [Solirubrobacteraceae bacterium]
MHGRIPTRAATAFATMLAAAAVLAWATASAGAVSLTPVYNNIPATLPGNVPSEAFDATSTSQFGGEVELAGPTLNTTKVSVAMSSWACQSGGAEDGSCVSAPGSKFEWPVTLHIYAAGAGDAVGTQIASLTKTFKMPYRPSANATRCAGNGGWYRAGSCFHGKLFKIAFPLKGVSIPSKTIVSVSFNTSDYGAQPSHVPGPYDSLNIGGFEGPPSVGSDPQPQSDYTDSQWTGAYCDAGAAGTGTFRFDPALPSCIGTSDDFDNAGLQPGITIATG